MHLLLFVCAAVQTVARPLPEFSFRRSPFGHAVSPQFPPSRRYPPLRRPHGGGGFRSFGGPRETFEAPVVEMELAGPRGAQFAPMAAGGMQLGHPHFGLGVPGVQVLTIERRPGLRGAEELGPEIAPADFAHAFSGLFDPVAVPLAPASAGSSREGLHPLDAFVAEVLGGLGVEVASAVPAVRSGPPACANDTATYCPEAGPRDVWHCLSAHGPQLSPACEQTFARSLPVVCKDTIDRECDLLQEGMLPCLKRQTDLPTQCAEAYNATVTSITTVRDGIEKGAVVVHPDTTQRPLIGDSESYFDQFKSFAARILEPGISVSEA